MIDTFRKVTLWVEYRYLSTVFCIPNSTYIMNRK